MSHPSAGVRFHDEVMALVEAYRPTRHRFFARLAAAPPAKLTPALLGQLHLRYQAAMHATRVMVYHLPHLDSPALRARKLQIYIDDDGLVGGDTHHHQLTRAFANLGAQLLVDDEGFGELDERLARLDAGTAGFVSLVEMLYPRSLGPWCIVELVSDDWMQGLAAHLPSVRDEPYFADCFAHGVEERQAPGHRFARRGPVHHGPPGVRALLPPDDPRSRARARRAARRLRRAACRGGGHQPPATADAGHPLPGRRPRRLGGRARRARPQVRAPRSRRGGRAGRALSIGYDDVQRCLDGLGLAGMQLVVEHRDARDGLVLRVATSAPPPDAAAATADVGARFDRDHPRYAVLARGGWLHPLAVEWVRPGGLELNPTSGKLRRVVDRRAPR